MNCYKILISVSFLLFFNTCKNNNNTSSSNGADNTLSDSLAFNDSIPNNDSEIKTIYAWVDKLRMRAQPDTKAEILAELKEGEPLIYLNEKTDFTEKITLRGQLRDEPWLKVKTQHGKEGWVFGGGVNFYKPKVDAAPSPYDGCFTLLKAHRNGQKFMACVDRIENKQLKKDNRFVKKTEEGLTFKLLSGDQKRLIGGKGSGEQLYYTHFNYRYYIPKMGYFVVRATGHESGTYLMVNDKSGRETEIWGYPKPSPDFKHLVVTNPDLGAGFENNGIQILGFTDQGLRVIWEIELTDFEPYLAKWMDDTTIEIHMRPSPDKTGERGKIVELKQNDLGDWYLDG